jgi:hypothetical protein
MEREGERGGKREMKGEMGVRGEERERRERERERWSAGCSPKGGGRVWS